MACVCVSLPSPIVAVLGFSLRVLLLSSSNILCIWICYLYCLTAPTGMSAIKAVISTVCFVSGLWNSAQHVVRLNKHMLNNNWMIAKPWCHSDICLYLYSRLAHRQLLGQLCFWCSTVANRKTLKCSLHYWGDDSPRSKGSKEGKRNFLKFKSEVRKEKQVPSPATPQPPPPDTHWNHYWWARDINWGRGDPCEAGRQDGEER
jgi:hypothetical protein